jgi:hypothetical protein
MTILSQSTLTYLRLRVGRSIATTSRPLYCPQTIHAWCFTMVLRQFGQAWVVGNVRPMWRRRVPDRVGLVRFLGVAM